MILLNDNSRVDDKHKDNLIIKELVGRDLNNLAKDNFIVFPPTIAESIDLDSANYLFRSSNRQVFTGNLVGVLKKGSDEIRITSRFFNSKGTREDYFIRYLLQRVTNINVIRNKVSVDSESSYYDLLVFLFPMYLDAALQKGLYKEYVTKSYNDANVKGSIDITRHIKSNTPFMGKIFYNTREFSFDNKLTQLIRHTIEKLQMEYNFDSIVGKGLTGNIRSIVSATPSYSRLERAVVLDENIFNPVRHGYFEEYYLLQKLCIQILNEEKIGFGDEDEEVYGIIIDVAWLWEEYLATLLTPRFVHAENKTRKNPIYFYSNKKNPRYPDFYSEKIILDAKYKKLGESKKGGISREDLYQMTSYLHVRKAESAGLIFPLKEESAGQNSPSKAVPGYTLVGELAGFGGNIFKVGFSIPQHTSDYIDFVRQIQTSEDSFLNEMSGLQE